MPTMILMPALSATMTEGKLVKWLKKEGDPVKRGEAIAEVETDKTILEIESTEEGTLGMIVTEEVGASIAVNQPIAIILDARDMVAIGARGTTAEMRGQGNMAGAGVRPTPAWPDPGSPTPNVTRCSSASSGTAGESRILASPLARRLAGERGIDLAKLKGSGPLGRILRADVEAATHSTGMAADGATPAVPSIAKRAEVTFRAAPHTVTRKAIARRLVESKATIPHFYLTIECELDATLSLRQRLNRGTASDHLSINDFIICASALALREQPAVNASWTEEAIHYYERVDVAVAVATSDGLITPIIRDADLKTLATISSEMKELTLRARDQKLKPDEFQGGGFTVSNLGMYGIKQFEAIINPPQAAVLAVGEAAPRAVVRGGAIAVATLVTCSLSCDHRVIDGAEGAKFLRLFKRILEDPTSMYP